MAQRMLTAASVTECREFHLSRHRLRFFQASPCYGFHAAWYDPPFEGGVEAPPGSSVSSVTTNSLLSHNHHRNIQKKKKRSTS